MRQSSTQIVKHRQSSRHSPGLTQSSTQSSKRGQSSRPGLKEQVCQEGQQEGQQEEGQLKEGQPTRRSEQEKPFDPPSSFAVALRMISSSSCSPSRDQTQTFGRWVAISWRHTVRRVIRRGKKDRASSKEALRIKRGPQHHQKRPSAPQEALSIRRASHEWRTYPMRMVHLGRWPDFPIHHEVGGSSIFETPLSDTWRSTSHCLCWASSSKHSHVKATQMASPHVPRGHHRVRSSGRAPFR